MCDYVTAADNNCDICNSTVQSRLFCGLLVRKNGVAVKWIDQPYIVKMQGQNAVIQEIIPNAESITIARVGTSFGTLDSFKMAIDCPCNTVTEPIFWISDSLDFSPVFLGDTMSIVGEEPIYVTLDSINRKYRISIDTTGLGGGGGGGTQNFINSSDATSHTLTLSGPNGSIQYVEGAGIGLATTGTTSDAVLTITNTGGTVTSVGLVLPTSVFDVTVSPVTSSGSLTATFDNQSANTVFAGPSSGGAATPAFRALVAADLPSGTNLWTDAGLYTYLTSTTDRAVVGSATELNTSYRFQAAGGAFIQGAGSTSGTYGMIVEKADGTDILNIRNDGKVGILNASPAYELDVAGNTSITGIYYITSKKMMYNPFSDNFFFAEAGNLTTTADRAIGIGNRALLNITSGSLNVAIGSDALRQCTTCSQNFAIGPGTLQRCTTGVANVGVGLFVLNMNTASNNTGIGDQVMTVNSTGTANVGIGTLALYNNTTGSNNTAVGRSASISGQDGSSNTSIGTDALNSNVSGNNIVAIGREALYSATGNNNTAVGKGAGVNVTSGIQNLLLGYRIDAPSATGNYQVSIANIIYATNADGTGTTVSSGKVGVKNNNPQRDLQVSGEVRITDLVTDPATLLVGADADGDLSSLNAAAAQTLLGYVDGTGVANRIAYWSDANTLANDAAYTVDAVNDRVTITGTVAGTGANNAFLNLNSGAISGATEFMRMSGNISGNMLAVMSNANTAAGTSNSIFQNASGGAAGGDPIFQLTVSGVLTSSIGIDNSDGDKLKLTPNSSTPGGTADHGIILTNDAVTLVGINKDVPVEELDVNGEVRARHFLNTGNLWNNSLCTFGASAGTGPAINLLSGGNNFYIFEFTTGSAPAADTRIAILTFPDAYPIGPTVSVFSARNKETATDINKFFVGSSSDTALDIQANGTLLANTPYKLMIHTGGRE